MLGDLNHHTFQEISQLIIVIDGLQENPLMYYVFICNRLRNSDKANHVRRLTM